MRIVITGGAGFIGSAVVRAALADSRIDEVVVVDTFQTGLEENLRDLPVTVFRGSIADTALMEHVLRADDGVVHLAARPSVPLSIADPMATNTANVVGTLSLLESCRAAEVGSVVAASSSSVYGSNTELPKQEEAWLGPLSPYAVSKLATEAYTISYQSSFGMRTSAFRFFNVYGPRQRADGSYPAVVPAFLSSLLEQRPVIIHGDGEQTRDFTFVENVAEVLVDAVAQQLSQPRPVNLAFGHRTSINVVLNALEELTGLTATRSYVGVRTGDIRDSHAASARLESLFPTIEHVTLLAGLAATLEWFIAQRAPQ